MSQPFIKVTIRIVRTHDQLIREIAEQQDANYSDIIRDFIRKGIEGSVTEPEQQAKPKRVIEVFYCQSCAKEISTEPNSIKFRDDIFKFCDTCFLTQRYKEVFERIAKTYEF